MKKLFAVLLSLAMILTLIACRAEKEVSDKQPISPVDGTSSGADANDAPAEDIQEDGAPEVPDGTELPAISVSAAQLTNAALQADGKTVELSFSEPVTISDVRNIFVSSDTESILFETPGPVVNAADFGAVSGDTKDDTQSLQDALNAAKDGGVIYFPAGEYLVSKCLMYYSNQTLFFEDGAVLKRGDPECRSLLANYMEGTEGGYTATENVNIIGAVFDGNDAYDTKNVMMNSCHIRNLNVINCTFRNGNETHYYECNSGENLRIIGCVFEDSFRNGHPKAEYLQIDRAGSGAYGDKISVMGTHTAVVDDTPCRNVLVADCEFYGVESLCPGIGNHANAAHSNIVIQNCTFIGGSPMRGSIAFGGGLIDSHVLNNHFSQCERGITSGSKDSSDFHVYESNVFEDAKWPLHLFMEWSAGTGEEYAVSLPCVAAPKNYAWLDGVEINGCTYGTVAQITFDNVLGENARIIALVGSVWDQNGRSPVSDYPSAVVCGIVPITK